MGLGQKIAWRYLFAKKSTNAINWITGISVLGITIGTAALILVLSVFNGFESVIMQMIGQLNPDLLVRPASGKSFRLTEEEISKLSQIPGVLQLSQSLEEIALFEYDGNQAFGYIKGVDSNYRRVTEIDSTILLGDGRIFGNLETGVYHSGLFGLGIANKLGINVMDRLKSVSIHMPRKKRSKFDSKAFVTRYIYPRGIYSIQQDQDYDYVLVPIHLVRELLNMKPGELSALEIDLKGLDQVAQVKEGIRHILGESVEILDRYEQDVDFIKIIKVEKLASFVIFSLILLLVAFNLVGSLWMIVLDKKLDISILRSMGVTRSFVKGIFIREGLLITCIGIFSGIVLALLTYWAHQRWGLVPVQDNFIVEKYPVELRWLDFLITALTVLFIGYLASILPARRAQEVDAYVRSE